MFGKRTFMKEMVDYGVLGFLGFLSVLVVAIAIERIWFYSSLRVSDYDDKRFLELDLHKRLTLVSTIGSNAPYVGLLGTVAGIMITFVEIGADNSVDTGAIMTGLSLALKATAAGLIVAIPSIVAYNLLTRSADVILTKWDIHHNPNTKPAQQIPNRQVNATYQPTPQNPQQTAQRQATQPQPTTQRINTATQISQNPQSQSPLSQGTANASANATPRI